MNTNEDLEWRIVEAAYRLSIEGRPNSFTSWLKQVLLRIVRSLPSAAKQVLIKLYMRTRHLAQQTRTDIHPQRVTQIVSNYLTLESMRILWDTFDLIVFCTAFPGGNLRYGGGFIESRVKEYLASELTVLVIEVNATNNPPVLKQSTRTYSCLRINERLVGACCRKLAPTNSKIACHSPTPETLRKVLAAITSKRILVWHHGADVRDYRRLYYNFDTKQRALQQSQLDLVHKARMDIAKRHFKDPRVTNIFPSEFLRSVAKLDVGVSCENSHVIANYVDTKFFRHSPKPIQQCNHFLMIRPFTTKNYGYDFAVRAIGSVLNQNAEVHFSVFGFGPNFESEVKQLKSKERVSVEERVLSGEEMRAAFQSHGFLLAPTRHDTQGMTMCEAMSCGVIPITNAVTAIPEFVSETGGYLCDTDCSDDFASLILQAHSQRSEFKLRSMSCAQSIRDKCRLELTIGRELDLIRT